MFFFVDILPNVEIITVKFLLFSSHPVKQIFFVHIFVYLPYIYFPTPRNFNRVAGHCNN